MSDNIINFLTGVPLGSDEDADTPELTDIEIPASNMWQAAVTTAAKDGALWGVLLYVNHEGELFCSSIGADRASLRGLLEETVDDLRVFRGG